MGVPNERVPVDSDRDETLEWLESLEAVVREAGCERGQFLLKQLEQHARALGVTAQVHPYSAYRNTLSIERQGPYPGDLAVEERITAIIRWNALAMVVRANQAYGELGGHIASYASAAEIFEVGFNHFFVPVMSSMAAIWCFSSRTRHQGSMPGRSLRGACLKSNWRTIVRKSAATA